MKGEIYEPISEQDNRMVPLAAIEAKPKEPKPAGPKVQVPKVPKEKEWLIRRKMPRMPKTGK